jgi:hypothetical protein
MGKPEVLIKDAQFNDLYADQMDELMTMNVLNEFIELHLPTNIKILCGFVQD